MDRLQVPGGVPPEQTGYGLGMVHLVVDGLHLPGHTGAVPGYSAVAMHNEAGSYTIAILSNLSLVELVPLLSQLQDVVLQR
jgi:D-alanyl-D-alanine carboxypeptidase